MGVKILEVKHSEEHQKTEGERPDPDTAEQVDRPLGVALVEDDQEQVEDDVERPAESVLGTPGRSGSMMDLEFGDPRPLPGGKDGDEPVHLAVEPDPLEHSASIRLHRAAEVMERNPREPG